MTDPIRDLQLELERERKRSHDLAACLAEMGRVNGDLRMIVRSARRFVEEVRKEGKGPFMAAHFLSWSDFAGEVETVRPPPPTPASQEPRE